MAKARKQRRLKSADEAFMGPKPTYAEENGVLVELNKNTKLKDEVARMHEWMRGTRWFYYFEVKIEITKQNKQLLDSLIILDKTFNIKYLEKSIIDFFILTR